MTNNSPFDDHIKKQLADLSPDVPPHIWEHIMAKKEKRKPGGWLFFLGGNRFKFIVFLFIVASCSGLLINRFYKNDTVNDPDEKAPVAPGNTIYAGTKPGNAVQDQNMKTINNNRIDKEETALASTSTTGTASTNPDLENKEQKNENNTTAAKAGGQPINHTPTINPAEEILTATTTRNVKEKNTGPASTSKAAVTEKNDRKAKQAENATPENKAVLTAKDEFANTKNKTRRSAAKARLQVVSPGTEATAAEEALLPVAPDKNNDHSLSNYFLQLNNSQVEKTFSFTVKNTSLRALSIPCPESEKNAAANKKYIEFYGGPDYAFRSFNDTANSTYLQKRKESTRFSSAFSLGVRYTRVFNNAVSFRTGINYSQVNEKFRYEQGRIVQTVYMIDAQGDTTGSYATTGTRYKTTHNKYRTIDIPLVVGYEMGNGRLHTNINAGLVLNVYSWQKGDILDTELQPINITTGKTNSPYQFKTNAGLGFLGGVSFYYKLSNRMHFLAEPYFRYNFSAANKADITLKQKYTTTGLRLGIRIDF